MYMAYLVFKESAVHTQCFFSKFILNIYLLIEVLEEFVNFTGTFDDCHFLKFFT